MEKWKSFKKIIVINKPIDIVYRCWATKGQIESWFLEKADFTFENKKRKTDEQAQKGDHFYWKWNNWDFTEEGEIREANGKDLISFTFGPGGFVSVSLKEVQGGTEVTLVQDDIPVDEEGKMNYYVGCITGWTFWLTNLKAYLEHNITLHAIGLKQHETKYLVNS